MTYLRKVPLNAPHKAIEMIATGIMTSGAQTRGSAHMPKVTTTRTIKAGSVTQKGQGPSHFTPATLGDPC